MIDARSLFAAASGLAPGVILSIGRPNSLFQACIAILGWPASDHLRHASTTFFKTSAPMAALAEQAWPHSGYRKQIIAERNGRILLANGQIVDHVTLDEAYANLRDCVALEVDTPSFECLHGASELIRRHRPMLVIERSRDTASEIARLLREHGYVAIDANGGEIAGGVAVASDYVLALPEPARNSSLPGNSRMASPRSLVTQRRQELARDPLSGWSCSLEASDVCLLPGTRESQNGQLRWWTGPGRKSRLFVWLPAEGVYNISVEIAEFSYPAELGLTLTRSLEKGESVNGPNAIELKMSISRNESRDAFPITLLTPEPWWRPVGGRNCKVGVAVSGLRIDRLSVLQNSMTAE